MLLTLSTLNPETDREFIIECALLELYNAVAFLCYRAPPTERSSTPQGGSGEAPDHLLLKPRPGFYCPDADFIDGIPLSLAEVDIADRSNPPEITIESALARRSVFSVDLCNGDRAQLSLFSCVQFLHNNFRPQPKAGENGRPSGRAH